MNPTDTNDDQLIARLRSALDEVTAQPADTAMVPLRSIAARPHPVRWLAGAAAALALIGAIAWVAGRDDGTDEVADSTVVPTTPTDSSTPSAPDELQMRYFLSVADLAPEPVGVTTVDPQGVLHMAWARGGDPSSGLLSLQASIGPGDLDPAQTYARVIDNTTLYFSGYGFDAAELARLADSVVAGSGLPWVLPEPDWEVVAVGEPSGTGVMRRYSNASGLVTLGEGPYDGEWSLMATADSIIGVEVAGQPGWKATNTNAGFTVVMWRIPDSSDWATLQIESTLADRVDGLIAAVVDVTAGLPTPETVPAPQATRYQGTVGVIDSGSGPMIAFEFLDSLPPQGGSIPLEGFDWSMIDGEQTVDGTTWFTGPVLVTGNWDGTTFTLTEPALAGPGVEWPPAPTNESVTPGCTDENMAPALDFVNGLDFQALQIISTSDDSWDGRCGARVEAAFDTPELRAALAPLGDQVTFSTVFVDVTD